jgi:pimeloyl-ACP methyl ester carboxylesterase
VIARNPGASEKTYSEQPITVSISGRDIEKGVESLQAEVSVYRMNSRTDAALYLDKSYQLSAKMMKGRLLTRVDFKDDRPVELRTAITDGETTILLNPETEEISFKMVSDDAKNPAHRIFGSQNYLSRINLSLLREEARRIALDVREDNDTVYSISLPNETMRVARGDRVISNRISFDAKDEVLSSMESVTVTADGTRITMTVTPMYEKKDGVPVKIGQTTVISRDIPRAFSETIAGGIYDSPDDIPTLSSAEYEELSRKGLIFEKTGVVFGDPGDPSYTETVVEIYQDVRVNETQDIVFRSFWEAVTDGVKSVATSVVSAVTNTAVTIVNGIINLFNPGSNAWSSPAASPSPPSPSAPAGHQGYEQPPGAPPAESVDGKKLNARVQNRTENNTSFYFFNGFDFENHKVSKAGMTQIIANEYRAITQGGVYTNKDDEKPYEVTKSADPYVVVGHSEGGLRALGYATYLERYDPEEFKKLRGVVTISGANKGFKALEGGIPVFREKLYNVADTFGNGLKAQDPTGLADILPSTEQFVNDVYKNEALRWLISFIPGPLNNYVLPVLVNKNPDEIAEIRDMVPFSPFANTYVADTDVKVVKVVTGKRLALVTDPWPHIKIQETYKYYTKYSNEQIRFSRDLPVLYIVGEKSGTLNMLGDRETGVRNTIKFFEITFGVVEGLNVAGVIFPDFALTRTANAIDADKARRLMANFDDVLTNIIGSPQNDGLLAEESQYYTQGNVYDRKYAKENHTGILENADVWRWTTDFIKEQQR